ncbi:GNAT family N-acetyltransferase [Endozoicomonas numazuensis]|uniref:N-acetyltransferase domain-containing protein n=1 Tax=Endozoicomonas numazuensis TaxID=1137799 RepID=A0A081MZB0_9GAMM|nr:GNAT family N-acetyltransferase [Endozoicomonas numazuensis]KEQ11533.1 hypothetical protein GZ78_28725 [Endozoicomonas numazuensis]
MKIDKDKFINAGMNYIYELDQYPRSSVKSQVTKEFDELLELNDSAVLLSRLDYIGIGEASDYLNHLIETDEGSVIAGIRHLGGDKEKPFVFVWPSFKINSIRKIIHNISPYFEIFKPDHYCYWSRPDCNDSGEVVVQQRFIGRIAEMHKSDFFLLKPESYYEWYKSEYDQFHKDNPEYINRIQVNSKEVMDSSQKEGLLYLYTQGVDKLGLIAGENDTFLDEKSIYINELLIAHNYRGKGYANNLLSSFIALLDAEYLICDIDSDNIPSTKAALRSGQSVFSQEVFVSVS